MLTTVFFGFALFASAISTNKVILSYISPALFVTLRMFCAGFFLLVYNGFKSPRLRTHYIKPDLFKLIIIASCTTFIPSLLKAYALQNLISSKAAFLGSLDPFITAFFAFFMYNERLSLQKFVGIFIGIIGISILLFSSASFEAPLHTWYAFSYPELAALIAVIISRFGWMEAQKLLKVERYTPSELNALLMVFGSFYSLLVTFYTTNSLQLCLPLDTTFILLFLYTVFVGNIIAYTLYAKNLKQYSVTFVSLAGLSVPLFVHIFGWLFLGENLSGLFFISLCITLIGLYIFYQDKPQKVIV
jgi:drug/metabolite transporter (DMT)-like permease